MFGTKEENEGRILVVEDNGTERDGIMQLLAIQGHRAIGVSNVRTALKHVHNQNISIVLLDYHLNDNGMTGFDVISRWLKERPETHFIILTGEREPETVVEMMKNGATDYLTKPVDPEKLLKVIDGILSRSLA